MDGPAGEGPTTRRVVASALVAAVGLALALTLWGLLRAAPAVGPFVALRAVGCGGTAWASGFTVADDLVVTAAHPVAGRTRIAVTDSVGRSHYGFVVALDAVLDVAAVRVPGLSAEPVEVVGADDAAVAPPGAPVTVAAADVDGQVISKPGTIERRVRANIDDIYRSARVSRRALELSFDGGYGDSGAAVLNSDGAVVGMVFATSRSRPNAGYAIRAVEINAALAHIAEPPQRSACP